MRSLHLLQSFLLLLCASFGALAANQTFDQNAEQAELHLRGARYSEAEQMYRLALGQSHGTETNASQKQQDILTDSLLTLGLAFLNQAKIDEAEQLFHRSMESGPRAHGPQHRSVAAALAGLASVRSAQNRYPEMEPLLLRALAIWKTVEQDETYDMAVACNNLAQSYKLTARFAEADPLYQKSLAIFTRNLGPTHTDVALGMVNQADPVTRARQAFCSRQTNGKSCSVTGRRGRFRGGICKAAAG